MNEEKLNLIIKFVTWVAKESKGHELRIQYKFLPFLEGTKNAEALGSGYLLVADWRDEDSKHKECSVYLEI